MADNHTVTFSVSELTEIDEALGGMLYRLGKATDPRPSQVEFRKQHILDAKAALKKVREELKEHQSFV